VTPKTPLLTFAALAALAVSSSAFAANTMPSRTPVSYSSKPSLHVAASHVKRDDWNDRGQRDNRRSSYDQRDDRNDRNHRGGRDDRRASGNGWDGGSFRHADFRDDGRGRGGSHGKPSWGHHDDGLDLTKVRRNDPDATFWKDLGRDPWGNNSGWQQIGIVGNHSVWKISSDGVTYYKVYDNNADQKFWNDQKGNNADQTLWRLREDDHGRGGVLVLRDNDRGITLYKVNENRNNHHNPVIGPNGFQPVNWNKVDDDRGHGHGHGKPGHGHGKPPGHGHGHGHGHHHPRPPVSGC